MEAFKYDICFQYALIPLLKPEERFCSANENNIFTPLLMAASEEKTNSHVHNLNNKFKLWHNHKQHSLRVGKKTTNLQKE